MQDSLSIILYSSAFDRIHYGLMLASAAAATNQKVTVFVTMDACHAFTTQSKHQLTLSDGVASLNMTSPAELEAHYQQQGIAGFSDLVEACIALEVNFLVCETGLRAIKLDVPALDPAFNFTLCGLVTLLNASSQGKMVMV